jgi:signal transduction histidine kinase
MAEFERQLERRHRTVAHRRDTRLAVLAVAADALDSMISAVRDGGGTVRRPQPPPTDGEPEALRRFSADTAHALADFAGIAATTAAECMSGAPERLASGIRALNVAVTLGVASVATSGAGVAAEELREIRRDERRHLARALHDRLAADVKVAHQQLELYELLHDKEPDRAHRRVVSARRTITTVLSQIRQLAFDLRFTEEFDGLEQSLRIFLASVETDAVTLELAVTGDERRFPPLVRNEVYLAVREAVRNALLHSRGRSIAIVIDARPERLRALVRDDGIGLEGTVSSTMGTGMASMQERVALLGGLIHIEGATGQGTTVEILIPAGP